MNRPQPRRLTPPSQSGVAMKIAKTAGLFFLCLTSMLSLGCEKVEKLEFTTQFQVIFLDNNNAYIGKMQQTGKDYIRLANVFYIQSQADPETKQVSNTLTKRGSELHKPDFMYINTQHILMIEPVTPDSQVAKLIEQSEIEATKQIAPSDTGNK